MSADFLKIEDERPRKVPSSKTRSPNQPDLEVFMVFYKLLVIRKNLVSSLKDYHDKAENRNLDGEGLNDVELQ